MGHKLNIFLVLSSFEPGRTIPVIHPAPANFQSRIDLAPFKHPIFLFKHLIITFVIKFVEKKTHHLLEGVFR